MNRQRAKELLPIIQAYAEGKVIQTKQGEVWRDEAISAQFGMLWNLPPESYRVKPEPREWSIVKWPTGQYTAYLKGEGFVLTTGCEVIDVREVVE